IETIPNAAIRRGDMSASPTLIYDPTTGAANGTGRTPFPLNQVPSNLMEPIALKIQSMLPNPTFDSLTANLFAQGKYQFNSQKMDSKINWNASEKLTLF